MKRYRTKKKIAFILSVILLLSMFPSSIVVSAVAPYDFANFTEVDSMAFVEECGIEIPAKLFQFKGLAAFTRNLILNSYYNPNTAFNFNYYETQMYAEEIREAVCLFMNTRVLPAIVSEEVYELQYSTVMNAAGEWVTSGGAYKFEWEQYNCYAYAINRIERSYFYQTNLACPYAPGDMSGSGRFEMVTTILELAEIVREDLLAMNYSNVSISSTIPSIDSHQELICVRMNAVDYHFMRYDIDTDAWYHKFANTAVLKYNSVPTNSLPWYQEYSYRGEESILLDYTGQGLDKYDSDIVFITYSQNEINVNDEVESRKFIQPDKDVLCELNFENFGNFNIEMESEYEFIYELYDEDFRILYSGSGLIMEKCLPVTRNKYYLRINFISRTILHYVDIAVEAHTQHSYATWNSLSATQHECSCICGESIIEEHVKVYVPCNNDSYHLVRCACGYQANSPHVVNPTSLKRAPCILCGAMVTIGNNTMQPWGNDCEESPY